MKNNLTGKTFGRWTVLHRGENKGRLVRWECLCTCGTSKLVYGCSLVNGKSTSCGCARTELHRQRLTKHGMSQSKVHGVWNTMVQRCTNPNSKSYPHYGGRGITICPTWMDFSIFLQDMGLPQSGQSIDRIDNNLGYSKDNCRWVSVETQANNKRTTIYLTHNNETKPLRTWAKEIGIKPTTLWFRINKGWDTEKALSTNSTDYHNKQRRKSI